MHLKNKNIIVAILALMVFAFCYDSSALPANWKPKTEKESEALQAARTHGGFDNQPNTVSNIQFFTSNYGIFGQNVAQGVGGGYWPRGSVNQYIFGGGIWFGTIKPLASSPGDYGKFVVVSYDPSAGESWLTPGTVYDEDGNYAPKFNSNKVGQYKVYTSTDFDRITGSPISTKDGYSWPIWDTETDEGYILKYDRYFGRYVPKQEDRNKTTYPRGPAFISGEDIYSVYKDTDLKQYVGGEYLARKRGYPLTLQFEQMIYSWGFGMYKDFIFMKYDIINFSADTLHECWMAPMLDVDIAVAPYTNQGANNDFTKYCDYADTLNMAFQWTAGTAQESGKGFGYLGYDFLESPSTFVAEDTVMVEVEGQQVLKSIMCSDYADLLKGEINPNNNQPVTIDTSVCIENLYFDPMLEGYVRKDKRYYANRFQLGLQTMKNWNLEFDMKDEVARYDGMSSKVRDGDQGQGDKRFMMATGPFSVMPKDTVRVVVGIILANPAVRKECDGSDEDIQELIKKDMFAQKVYDFNFRAPQPPENTYFLGYNSFNNAIEVYWDSTAEMSTDKEEKGMDFLGYKLYRARNPYLDTFAVVSIPGNAQYTNGRSPYGWKELAAWEISTPFYKTEKRGGMENAPNMPLIDEIRVVGISYELGNIDTMAIKVIRIPKGLIYYDNQIDSTYQTPYIVSIDTGYYTSPWDKYFKKLYDLPAERYFFKPDAKNGTGHLFIDSIMVGTIKLNKALLRYNPLYWSRKTVAWNSSIKDSLPVTDSITKVVYLYNSRFRLELNGTTKEYYYQMVPMFDSTEASFSKVFENYDHLKAVRDSIYSYLQTGKATAIFNDFEGKKQTKDSVIVPYMRDVSNARKYYDWGDDNGTKVVDLLDESTRTEKIINNIEYYYKLEAWDEGDYNQPTERKQNNGSVGRPNNIMTYAKAGRPTDNCKFELTYVDENKIGGLYDFELFPIDNEKVSQKLAGRTLELTFEPNWRINSIKPFPEGTDKTNRHIGFYDRIMTLRDSTTKEVLFQANTQFERPSGTFSVQDAPTENAFSVVMNDVVITDSLTGDLINFGLVDNNEKRYRNGEITTQDFKVDNYRYSYGFANGYENIFGFKFKYAYEQRGGVFRFEEGKIVKGNASTPIRGLPLSKTLTTNTVDIALYPLTCIVGLEKYGVRYEDSLYSYTYQFIPIDEPNVKDGSFNNGPGEYLVTFTEGGVENMSVTWINHNPNYVDQKRGDFAVPYLKYNIVNQYSFKRDDASGVQKDVKYGTPLEYMELPDSAIIYKMTPSGDDLIAIPDTNRFPSHANLGVRNNEFINKYNSFSTAFIKGNLGNYSSKFKRAPAEIAIREGASFDVNKPNSIGQGKYYLTVKNSNNDSICFNNIINIGGIFYMFDYYNRARFGNENNLIEIENYTLGEDFKVGDQVLLKSTGGAFGIPLPGAKVRFKVVDDAPANNEYTESQLDKVRIVPNPYYITTEVQPNPYQAYIYFTKLPSKCTIDIYTVTGDLVRTINHEEVTASSQYNDSQFAFDTWDLFSRNGQRVQSQTFVAVISTPNGEQSVQKFSVVVGGSRLITK